MYDDPNKNLILFLLGVFSVLIPYWTFLVVRKYHHYTHKILNHDIRIRDLENKTGFL